MRILITGSAGFIGTNLTRRLLGEGHQIIGVDNLYCSSPTNIAEFSNNPNFSFREEDIRNKLVIDGPLDWIFNLACPASPRNYQLDPLFTLGTCTVGVKNILDLATQKKAQILQASTSEVYGDPQEHPQGESYRGNVSSIGIRSCYDEGKRVAETYFMDYHRQLGTSIKLVRIFNTYGPFMAQEDGRVIPNLIIQALSGRDITIYGSGKQTRTFQYVSDLIEGMLRLMYYTRDFIGPVNLGGEEEITIFELANKILRLTNSNSKLLFCENQLDDPQKRKPNLSLAKKKLNWTPKTTLNEGLLKTIAYFRRII